MKAEAGDAVSGTRNLSPYKVAISALNSNDVAGQIFQRGCSMRYSLVRSTLRRV